MADIGLSHMLLAVLGLTILPVVAAEAADRAKAGVFTVERPTLVSLGFDWKIDGDDNRNSIVDIYYRKAGQSEWRKGLPMLRMGGEFVAGPKPQYGEQNYYDYTVPNGFAGSVLGLEPDTEYEVRLVLSDPDGVTGRTERDHARAHAQGADAGAKAGAFSTSIRSNTTARSSSRPSPV